MTRTRADDIEEALRHDLAARDDSCIGDRLPSEAQLAGRYRVARMTMRSALRRLVDDGMLDIRQGSPTIIRARYPQPWPASTTVDVTALSDEELWKLAGRAHAELRRRHTEDTA